jgi:hypothetical protein
MSALEEGGRIPIRSHTGVIGMDAKRSAKRALVILLENASLFAGIEIRL